MSKITLFTLIFLLLASSANALLNIPREFQIDNNPPPSHYDYTGVAPLAILFQAPEAVVDSSTSGLIKPFHDFLYQWDFGDPSSGVWGSSGKPKNTETGPIVAHVFEDPGTYQVTVRKIDFSGVLNTQVYVVYVTDPDTVFSGDKTTCISDTVHNDFTDCPTGANHLTTDNISNLSSYMSGGKRILFHRGSNWSINARPIYGTGATTIIGAYGRCINPSSQGICENAPEIEINGDNSSFFGDMKDQRVMDINFTSSYGQTRVLSSTIDTKSILALRLKSNNFYNPYFITHWRSDQYDLNENNFIVSCYSNNSTLWAVYIGSERLSILGNIFTDSRTSHVVRIWQAYQSIISHNTISGAGTTALDGSHALKFHGPAESEVGDYASTGSGGLTNRTKFTVISNNLFGGSGPWPIAIGPQNAQRDERISDIIFEKNKYISGFGTMSTPIMVATSFWGRYISIRNNIIDGTQSNYQDFLAIAIQRRGIEWTPLGNRVYNNTIFNSDNTYGPMTGIAIHNEASDIIVKNNYVSFPNAVQKYLINDSSGSAIATHNLLTDYADFVDSFNQNLISRDFHLQPESPANNQGTAVPVYDDFSNSIRDILYDLGAYNE